MTHKLFKLGLYVAVFKLYLLSSQLLSIVKKAQKLNLLFLWLQRNFLVCHFQKHIGNSIEINFLQNYQLNIKHSINFSQTTELFKHFKSKEHDLKIYSKLPTNSL
jgi:hypothetical protein